RGGELDVRLQRRQLFRKLADDLLQGALLDLEIALRSDLLGSREIEARLRLVSIGDGCSTNLEIAFRLGELLCYRDLLALNERETVLRCEHVEIGLGYAHDQILRRLAEGRFGLDRLEPRFLVDLEVLPVEQ